MTNKDLPFWQFFHQLEKELSYERWIDKYKLFIDAIFVNRTVALQEGDEWGQFRNFCKVLYLQDIRDEVRFDQFLTEAIAREELMLRSYLQQVAPEEKPTVDKPEIVVEDKKEEKKIPPPGTETEEQKEEEKVTTEDSFPEPVNMKKEKSMYYHPPVDIVLDHSIQQGKKINFLLTDEYFPVTRRQMVKGWQFLRNKEKSGFEDGIDIISTIKKVAKEGLFLEPVLNPSLRNREDTIIIYADYRGSMAPFHELTNRLIISAKGQGGHPKAPVFYFQNFPVGYVYKKQNLSGPVKLKESLAKTNRNVTLAIVISDAGAARGNTEDKHKQARLEMTEAFLEELNRSCSHTIWLNPMPTHRWKDTAAELISKKVFLMAPIFDHSNYNFQDTFRTVLKQNLKKTKFKQ